MESVGSVPSKDVKPEKKFDHVDEELKDFVNGFFHKDIGHVQAEVSTSTRELANGKSERFITFVFTNPLNERMQVEIGEESGFFGPKNSIEVKPLKNH
jgi:hypothetical protein